MKLKYIGPHGAGIDVLLPDGRVKSVAQGEADNFPDEVAKGLLAQDGCWEPADDKKPAKAGKEA